MLTIKIPPYCIDEIKYVLNFVFNDILGLEYNVIEGITSGIEINYNGKRVLVDDTFFKKVSTDWLSSNTLPQFPLQILDTSKINSLDFFIIDKNLPILYGIPEIILTAVDTEINFDIFGSIFFMLSRYEEAILEDRDKFDRFSGKMSVAFKGDFLTRPIVDEYIEVIWSILNYVYPTLVRKKLIKKTYITCDLDWPFDPANDNIFRFIRRCLRILFINKDLFTLCKFIKNYLGQFIGLDIYDQYLENTRYIMKINEEYDNKVIFFLIPFNTSKYDCYSNIKSERYKKLIKEILQRGHEIGIHPGFNTYNNYENILNSMLNFKQVLDELKLEIPRIISRQHYLRWSVFSTPQLQESIGIDYDSTLCYADIAGFRCGTSHEFYMYDIVERKSLRLKQIPLIAMEASIIGSNNQNLQYSDKAFNYFIKLKEYSHLYNGNYTLLWHNSHLEENDKKLYHEVIKYDRELKIC